MDLVAGVFELHFVAICRWQKVWPTACRRSFSPIRNHRAIVGKRIGKVARRRMSALPANTATPPAAVDRPAGRRYPVEPHPARGVARGCGRSTDLPGRSQRAGKTTLLRTIMGFIVRSRAPLRSRERASAACATNRIAQLGVGYAPEESQSSATHVA